jgi:hypothetical protein
MPVSSQCPKCGEPFSLQMVAKASDECRMRFSLNSDDGHLLSAKTIGGCLEQVFKLNAAVGKDVGYNCITLVEKIEPQENGFCFHLLLVRGADKKAQKR